MRDALLDKIQGVFDIARARFSCAACPAEFFSRDHIAQREAETDLATHPYGMKLCRTAMCAGLKSRKWRHSAQSVRHTRALGGRSFTRLDH